MAVLYQLSYRGMQASVIISAGHCCVNPDEKRNPVKYSKDCAYCCSKPAADSL